MCCQGVRQSREEEFRIPLRRNLDDRLVLTSFLCDLIPPLAAIDGVGISQHALQLDALSMHAGSLEGVRKRQACRAGLIVAVAADMGGWLPAWRTAIEGTERHFCIICG